MIMTILMIWVRAKVYSRSSLRKLGAVCYPSSNTRHDSIEVLLMYHQNAVLSNLHTLTIVIDAFYHSPNSNSFEMSTSLVDLTAYITRNYRNAGIILLGEFNLWTLILYLFSVTDLVFFTTTAQTCYR